MRNQSLYPAACLLIDERDDVRDQVLGTVGLDLVRRRGAPEAPHVGCDAAIAIAEVLEQPIPDERALRKAMQKEEDWLRRCPRHATLQRDPVGQYCVDDSNHCVTP